MKFCQHETGLLPSELRRRSWVCFQTQFLDQMTLGDDLEKHNKQSVTKEEVPTRQPATTHTDGKKRSEFQIHRKVKGLELAYWTRFHPPDCGKSTDSNTKKMPGLVGQTWVT